MVYFGLSAKCLYLLRNSIKLTFSPTVSKSDVGYCKNYYLKLSKESQTFGNFTNSSKGFQINVFNLVLVWKLNI